MRNGARAAHEPVGMLRGVYARGTDLITCEVRISGRHVYDVCIVPHWNVSASVVERYYRPGEALRRHAELSWNLRQAGWSVVRDGVRPAGRVAA